MTFILLNIRFVGNSGPCVFMQPHMHVGFKIYDAFGELMHAKAKVETEVVLTSILNY